MKTWPRFLTNLSNKSRYVLWAGALGLSLSPCFAQSGFYSNFKQLIEIQQSNYNKKLERLAGKPSDLSDMPDPLEAELDPDFLSSVIFHTPSRYAALGGASDKCGLYDLILSNLAKGPQGDLQKFLVRYKTKNGDIKSAAVERETFFKKIAFKQCPQVEKFQAYFSLANLPATLKTINLETPSSMEACLSTHKDFLKDPKTPYLCYLSEQIKSITRLEKETRTTPSSQYRKLQKVKRELRAAKAYKEMLNPSAVSYLDSLCSNVESSEAFCQSFFNASFWKRVASKEKSPAYMLSACRDLLQKTKLTHKDLAYCAQKFESSPRVCEFLGVSEGVLAPKPSCERLSSALNLSRLKADYQDCPGKVANPAIVNITRLLAHFSQQSPPESDFCHASATAAFARFNQETAQDRVWKTSLCYEDKLKGSEECLPVVYGDVADSELSLSFAVEKILRRTKGFGNDQKCSLLSQKDYRPELLKFKSGCFILINEQACYGTACDFKILLNQKTVTHIKTSADTKFDYFPKDFANANFAQAKLLEQTFKLHSSRVGNVSALKRVLDENKNALIHGIACAEDLYPEHFSKRSFNQCAPLPFIVDGYKEHKGKYSVVLRSGYDSLHAPRIVPWPHLFSALKDYQRLHPLNAWGLNALH